MEKVRRAYSKFYPVLRLYLDDIEELIQLFKKYYNEVSIVIDDYIINDNVTISDIKKEAVSSFSIQSHPYYDKDSKVLRGRITLELTQSYALLRIANDTDPFLLGIASQIDTVLMRRKSRLDLFTSAKTVSRIALVAGVLSMALGLIGIFISRAYLSKPFSMADFMAGLLCMTIGLGTFVIWSTWAYNVRNKRYCLIYLTAYHAKSNFFKRQKEQIFLLLIGAVIGSVVTVLVNWLAGLIRL